MTPPSITATRVLPVRRWSRIRGLVGWLSSAALRIGGGGEEGPWTARGGGGERGREGGFCGLRGGVSTVDSFDKGRRINGLIAGVRVVLRIGNGWLRALPPTRWCVKSRTLQLATSNETLVGEIRSERVFLSGY